MTLGADTAVMSAAPAQQTDRGMDRRDLGKKGPIAEVFAQLGCLNKWQRACRSWKKMSSLRHKLLAQAINRAQELIRFRVKEEIGEQQLLVQEDKEPTHCRTE